MSLLRYFSTVSADQKLPDPLRAIASDVLTSSISATNVRRRRACRANSTIPRSWRGSRTKSSRTYKGWDSKVSTAEYEIYLQPSAILQRRKAAFARPCRHNSRTPSTPCETAWLPSPHVLSIICPCVRSLRSWDGTSFTPSYHLSNSYSALIWDVATYGCYGNRVYWILN